MARILVRTIANPMKLLVGVVWEVNRALMLVIRYIPHGIDREAIPARINSGMAGRLKPA